MARTVARAVKGLVPDTSWRLEMLSTGEIDSKPLQGWRRLGTGDGDQMSRREQIAESLNLLNGKDVAIPPVSLVAGHLSKGDLESNPDGNSDGGRLRIMRRDEEDKPQGSERLESSVPDVADIVRVSSGENMAEPERSSSSLSDVSEFRNADSFVSEPEEYVSKKDECLESVGKKYVEKDDTNFAETEAYAFQIFHCDDEVKREPVSVFDLAFNAEEAEEYEVKLILIASPYEPPISTYMHIIDSWTMRADEKAQLLLYVRDVKGTWCKLCTPAKRYKAVFEDCHIVLSFLELAMKLGSKFKKPHTYYTKIQKLVRVDKSKIRDVLKKYYPSVIQKFVCKGGIPSLRDAQIFRTMKDSLKVSSETPNIPLGKTFKSGVQRKIAMAIRIVSKRKRVMESYTNHMNESGDLKELNPPKKNICKRKWVVDSEDRFDDGTDSEDLKPLLQRKFKRKKNGRRSESTLDEVLKICSGQGQEMNKSKGWRSDKVHELAEVRGPENLKDNLDIAEKSASIAVVFAESTKETIEAPASSIQAGHDVDAERRVSPEATRIYDCQDDMPEEFDSDDEEVGDAAFCAICDDGGDLLFCDGPCVRSFHASREAAAASSESKCSSLGFTVEEVKDMGSWLCPNCEYKRHQCFICGYLGSSGGENKEVFLCDVALCGRFYHPQCLGEFTNMSKREIAAFVKRIKDGTESVFCPAHKCLKCLEGEIEGGTDNSMKLAKCRRCPNAYHKICLPPSICFEEMDDEPIRAWEIGEDDDPVKRLVIYCLDHIIDDELNTPKRDHLRWPEEYVRKTRRKKEESPFPHEYNMHNRARKYEAESRALGGEESSGKTTSLVPFRLKGIQKKPDLKKVVSNISPAARTYEPYASEREQHIPRRTAHAVQQKPRSDKRTPLALLTMPISMEAVLRKVRELQEMSASIVTVESVHESLFHPSCYVGNPKRNFIRRGDLLSIINAAKKAVDKIHRGSIEDAKRICPRAYFQSLSRSEDALKVYLAPLLHGTRYTSYGRHFTNPEKLKEIIQRIQWYIDDGDMVVDFCCGANDFSTLLKEKLESVGKKCDYKNFDIHPPKNTFAFTKGDWFQNKGEGFAQGKKLVMGLNPPFGSKAALATKFVLHALTFRPKLLVLIVPPETMDGGRTYADFNYSLVWEDRELLSGKSFYLPGSLNKNDEGNIAQWNNVAPPLFVWCPAEMLRKNQQIAVRQQHVRCLAPVVPDLHTLPLRDLQAGHSQMPGIHLNSKFHVDIQEVRMQTTPLPSSTAARDYDRQASSGGLPSRSKSSLSDSGSTVPKSLRLQRSSSPDELSTPFSTPQSSTSSQDGLIPGHAADHLQSFKQRNRFDGRRRRAGFAGHHVALPNIAPEISSGMGQSDLSRKRMLIGMHCEGHTTQPRRRSMPSKEGIVHPGVEIVASGVAPTAVGLGPASLMNLRLHGNPPIQRQPQITQIQQGAPSHAHIPSNTSHLGIPRNPSPSLHPRNQSLLTGMQPYHPVNPNMQLGPGQPRWTLGGPPPPPPPGLGFAQSMLGARNQLPVHHVHGLQARMHTHIPGTLRHPGVQEFVPLVHGGFPRVRVGEDNFGRVIPPPPMERMRMGGQPDFGSGGWIENDG